MSHSSSASHWNASRADAMRQAANQAESGLGRPAPVSCLGAPWKTGRWIRGEWQSGEKKNRGKRPDRRVGVNCRRDAACIRCAGLIDGHLFRGTVARYRRKVLDGGWQGGFTGGFGGPLSFYATNIQDVFRGFFKMCDSSHLSASW